MLFIKHSSLHKQKPSRKVLTREARQDLLALPVGVRLALALLPDLLEGGELAHRGHLVAALLELVPHVALAPQDGRVHSAQHQIVLRAREVEQPQPVDVALVFGGQ